MRKLKFFLFSMLFFLGSVLTTKAQESSSFIIINDGGITNMPAYLTALNRNNLDKYRHINVRSVIEFESGVHVELFSANEMIQLGIPVDLGKVNQQSEETLQGRFDHVTFQLHSSGRIMEKVTPINQK